MSRADGKPSPGEQEAVYKAWHEHAGAILRFCRFLLRNEADAEDAVGEAFSRLCRNIGGLDRREDLGGWLRTVAWNEARRIHAARSRPAPAPPPPPAGPSPGTHLAQAERGDAVLREIDRLDPRTRALILMRVVENESYEEVAARLETTPGAARMELYRALQALRRRLAEPAAGRPQE